MGGPARIITTGDGSLSLYNEEISESYHSSGGAAWESEGLYVKSSGIELELRRSSPLPLTILDVGLGLGYNANATIDAWEQSPGCRNLELISLEHNRALIDALLNGAGAWQQGWSGGWLQRGRSLRSSGKEAALVAGFQHPLTSGHLIWTVLPGDAGEQISRIASGPIDFIWQDPFSPAKNPELWSREWFSRLKELAAPDCTLMTYSVARQVKDGLEQSGWRWEKIPASGPKRHWLRAMPAAC